MPTEPRTLRVDNPPKFHPNFFQVFFEIVFHVSGGVLLKLRTTQSASGGIIMTAPQVKSGGGIGLSKLFMH